MPAWTILCASLTAATQSTSVSPTAWAYNTCVIPLSEDVKALTPDMLSALQNGLRNDLKNALENLENDRMALVIGQLASFDRKIQSVLVHLADSLTILRC
jgi:hypothetical protein